jgi:hypothetical protein
MQSLSRVRDSAKFQLQREITTRKKKRDRV